MPMTLKGASLGTAVASRVASRSITRLMSPSSYCVRIENQRVREIPADCKSVAQSSQRPGDRNGKTKSKTQNPNKLRTSKEENPKGVFLVSSFGSFGFCLDFGFWILGFGPPFDLPASARHFAQRFIQRHSPPAPT